MSPHGNKQSLDIEVSALLLFRTSGRSRMMDALSPLIAQRIVQLLRACPDMLPTVQDGR